MLVDNDRRLIRDHAHQVREALFACTTQAQVECAVAFARFLSNAGLNSDNYWLFMRLVMTNNPWVIDELLHEREPRLLFSTIRPDEELIEAAFQALFARHPDEIYALALEAMLGIIQNAYFDADDGYRIRRLSIMDINTLGKFLLKAENQDHPVNRLILEILDRLARLGEYYGEPDKNVLSKHAFNVRYAYFDRTRELVDAIPEPLLVRLPDRTGVQPEDDYAELVARRRLRKRDSHGRFVKELNGFVAVSGGTGGVAGGEAAGLAGAGNAVGTGAGGTGGSTEAIGISGATADGPAKPAVKPAKPAAEPAKPAAKPAKPAVAPAKPTVKPAKPATGPAKPVGTKKKKPDKK